MTTQPSPSAAVRSTVERIEVWADGERIGTTFANPAEAERFANGLNGDWRSIEVVTIRREVRRVR